MPRAPSAAGRTLLVTLAVTLLAYVGIALPYPILAPLFLQRHGPGIGLPGDLAPEVALGTVLAAYPLGLFLGGQLLGAISDQRGRRPVLVISLLGTAFGYLGSAWAIQSGSFAALLASRLLTGGCEGNAAVARAVAADLHPHIEKTRSFAYLHGVATGGYLIGPILAGVMSAWGYASVFLVAAGLAVVALVLVLTSMQETLGERVQTSRPLEQIRRNWGLFRDANLRPLLVFYLLLTMGMNSLYHFFPFLLVQRWGLDSPGIARFTAVLTIFMMASNLILVNYTTRRLGRVPSMVAGCLGLAAALIVIQFVGSSRALYLLFPWTGICLALAGTHLTIHISDHARGDQQGRAMGLLVSLFQVSSILVVLGGSQLAALSLDTAFMLGTIATLLGLTVFVRGRRLRAGFRPSS